MQHSFVLWMNLLHFMCRLKSTSEARINFDVAYRMDCDFRLQFHLKQPSTDTLCFIGNGSI